MTSKRTISLPGSEHKNLPGATIEGPIQGDETVEVTVTLKGPASLEAKVKEMLDQPPMKRKYLSREEYAKTYSQTEGNMAKVEQFARENNLAVKSKNPEQQTMMLVGTARAMSQAFSVFLERYRLEGVSYRGRKGPVQIPEEMKDVILSVNGLDERPVAKPKFRVRPAASTHAGPSVTYSPQDVARLYSFPPGDGSGECIGIIELGGGFQQQDLKQYFGSSSPTVTAVAVDKGHNKPTGNPDGPDGEVMLDIEVCGSIAPKCQMAVYFAPNTNKGFIDAINAAVHDTTRKPSVISISWGGPEDGGGYSPSALASFHQAFQAAALMGVTVFAAAGDNGSSDGLSSGNHCDYPASDTLVTGCGGTTLMSANNVIKSETVWNDGSSGGATGGGMSTVYAVPAYQTGLQITMTNGSKTALTGRGVPDIAGDADPNTGYNVLVDGQSFPIGGTSCVAPLMAGLCALMNQELGKPVGALNPTIYNMQKTGTQVCRDITTGNNGTYAASTGWDACTGLGVPIGTALLAALGTSKTAA
jgi:kumamolisin